MHNITDNPLGGVGPSDRESRSSKSSPVLNSEPTCKLFLDLSSIESKIKALKKDLVNLEERIAPLGIFSKEKKELKDSRNAMDREIQRLAKLHLQISSKFNQRPEKERENAQHFAPILKLLDKNEAIIASITNGTIHSISVNEAKNLHELFILQNNPLVIELLTIEDPLTADYKAILDSFKKIPVTDLKKLFEPHADKITSQGEAKEFTTILKKELLSEEDKAKIEKNKVQIGLFLLQTIQLLETNSELTEAIHLILSTLDNPQKIFIKRVSSEPYTLDEIKVIRLISSTLANPQGISIEDFGSKAYTLDEIKQVAEIKRVALTEERLAITPFTKLAEALLSYLKKSTVPSTTLEEQYEAFKAMLIKEFPELACNFTALELEENGFFLIKLFARSQAGTALTKREEIETTIKNHVLQKPPQKVIPDDFKKSDYAPREFLVKESFTDFEDYERYLKSIEGKTLATETIGTPISESNYANYTSFYEKSNQTPDANVIKKNILDRIQSDLDRGMVLSIDGKIYSDSRVMHSDLTNYLKKEKSLSDDEADDKAIKLLSPLQQGGTTTTNDGVRKTILGHSSSNELSLDDKTKISVSHKNSGNVAIHVELRLNDKKPIYVFHSHHGIQKSIESQNPEEICQIEAITIIEGTQVHHYFDIKSAQ